MVARGALAAFAAVTTLFSGCGSTEKFRYKTTVEVETPEGLKSGFAVREIVNRTPPPIPMLGEDKGYIAAKGEAVAVDLPDGRTLFALLTSGDGQTDYAGRDIWFLFREFGGGVIQLWPNPPKTTKPEIRNPLPMLVTFEDITDPTSVKRVDPYALTKAFGPGVTLKRITITVTDEDLTVGVGKRLRWLGKYPEPSLNPNHGPNDWSPSASLRHGDFRKGAIQ